MGLRCALRPAAAFVAFGSRSELDADLAGRLPIVSRHPDPAAGSAFVFSVKENPALRESLYAWFSSATIAERGAERRPIDGDTDSPVAPVEKRP